MKVYIEKTNKIISASASTLKDLLKKLKINPTTIIATRNNEIILEDAKLNKNDTIKLLSVISGG